MTIPQTRFIILMLMLLQIIATMQVFTEPFVITGGGPENSTVTVLYLIYKYAFLYNDFGGACALSVMLLSCSASSPPSICGSPAPTTEERLMRRDGHPHPGRLPAHPRPPARPGRSTGPCSPASSLLFALAFLFPVYWMVTGAMKSPGRGGPDPADPGARAVARRPATPTPGT